MDFAFTDEQRAIAGVVRGLLAADCTGADLRRLMASGEARDQGRWAKLVALGLLGALAPEASGGLGLTETDLVLIAEACGYAALPEPLVEQAGVAVPLLAGFADDPRAARWLAAIIAGEATVAVGHPVNPFVADADATDALLLAHDGALHLVERHAVELIRQPSIDPFRRLFRLAWAPTAHSLLAETPRAAPALAAALDRGALFAAAQALGLAQRAVDLAVAYAGERIQFGKPIGSYQAVKHHLASAQVKIEFARPVVAAAAAELACANPISRARISHAKLAAVEAADFAARTAIQVHGAMGYSWEVDIHFLLKRALALGGAWGDASFHRARVAARALDLSIDHSFASDAAPEGRSHAA